MKYIKTRKRFLTLENYDWIFTESDMLTIKDDQVKKISNDSDLIRHYGNPRMVYTHFQDYLDKLVDLDYLGGTVYRLVIVPSIEEINREILGNNWTISKSYLSDIYSNIVADYKDGMLETEYTNDFSMMKVFLISAKTPKANIEVSNSFNQFESFPEEGQVYFKDTKKLEVVSIEEYKKED